MKLEELLHLFGPYLPTDRFRALLRQTDIPENSQGAALAVDISGFTPLTTGLVTEYGPQRAGEELKRRINPMFEAIAGQVFINGGSVIRFLGDGFTAWFDDHLANPEGDNSANLPGLIRAVASGLEMQTMMRFFKGLRLKVMIGVGAANRWVVGNPEHGLTDILSGHAVEAMISLAGDTQAGQVVVHCDAIPLLDDEGLSFHAAENGNAIVTGIPDEIGTAARQYRWPAWALHGDTTEIVDGIRPYVASAIRQQVESGFGDFVGEVRFALPMFVQFGGLTQRPAPQHSDARLALDSYVRTVQNILADSGGRLVSVEVSDKGNVVFAVFGAPVTYGDDTERALHAAMRMRDLANAMDANGNTLDTISAQRIGISRGLVYAGTIGGEVRHEYSTIGDETNVAARLMTNAALGQILASSNVRKDSGPRVVFQDLPAVPIKGRAEPIPVAEPISVRTGASRQHVGKFVGRETELNELRKFLKAVRLGHPRVVRVQGQAGIGKSRLIAELTQIAMQPGVEGGVPFRAAGGDCISTGRQTGYLPWRELLFSLFDLNLETREEESIARLLVLVEGMNAEWVPRLPLLGDVMQLQIPDTPTTAALEGRTRRQAIIAFVIDLILGMARKQPLLLILEDTQWIDEVSEALAIDLARRLSVDPASVFLVLIHRPPQESDHPPEMIRALSELHIHNHMLVDELSRNDVFVMVEKYLDGSSPPELSKFVYDRAQGNPFFVQEVLDTLLETGFIRAVGSRVVINRGLQDADLPRTVQGLVQARIDRLGEIDKLVLKVAAVIGRSFAVRVLADSLPIEMEYGELLDRLRTLEERDFSHRDESEAEMTYLFKHAITQEVTYQSLPFAQRRQLHQAVATALEVIAPDGVERLAYHYARSGDEGHARQYLVLAGKKAYHEYANQAALGYFTQALELARSDEENFDIGCQCLEIMLRLGDMQGVQRQIPALQQLATKNSRQDWLAMVHLFQSNFHTQTSAWANTIREAQEAIQIADEIGNDDIAWEGYLLLRGALLSLNWRDEIERQEIDRKMQVLADRLGDQRHAIELVLTWFDEMYVDTPPIAISGARSALARAEQLHDPVLEAECWSILGDLFARENDHLAALDAFRHQVALLRQIGDRRREGLTLNRIGMALISLGQLSEGNGHLLDAYRILHQIGERSGEAISLVYLGVIAYFYKAYDEALAYLNRGVFLQRALNAGTDAAVSLFHMGNAYLMKGELDDATRVLTEARNLNQAHGLTVQAAEVGAALAEIDLRRDDVLEAVELIKELLPRLSAAQIGGLRLPGLAYWRVVQILEKDGQDEAAAQLHETFRTLSGSLLERFPDRTWRTAYIKNMWYHGALLDEPAQ